MKIGFFDSGLGGLFILKHVAEELPDYSYVFLGDTENVPYGGKSDEEIFTLVTRSLRTLFEHDCLLVIFACNTASVTALYKVQHEWLPREFPDRKVLGVIIPTVEEILAQPTERVALIATERTIRSGKYERELAARDTKIKLLPHATPTLVPLIESDRLDEAKQEVINIVRDKLIPHDPDTLVLGCTHYSLLKDALREVFPHLRILSQDEIIPTKLRDYLQRHSEIETRLDRKRDRDFWFTRVLPLYQDRLHTWFGDFPVHPAPR